MTGGTILGEFAINPACITKPSDLKEIFNRFGFHHGAVISDFPNAWHKTVSLHASDLPEPDKSAFLDRLSRVKDSVLARVRSNSQGESWIEQARASAKDMAFYSILDTQSSEGARSYFEAMEQLDLTGGLREGKVTRTADSLVRSFLPLVLCSDKFTIVDPYVMPDAAYRKFIKALVDARRARSRSTLFVDLHLEFDENADSMRDGTPQCINAFEAWARGIGSNLVMTVHLWSDMGIGEIHPRYLLTERGGVRLDRGVRIPPQLNQQDHDTDVAMMTPHFVHEIERRYSGTYEPLKLKLKRSFRT